jgi:SAM-dependent methyltransferase
MPHDALYDDGLRYDLLYPVDPLDVRFYLDLAREYPGEILELACGTGKYLVPWAQAGALVTGLDAAPGMLARAAEKARAAGVSITLHEGDMRAFALPGRFDLIVIAGNSFCHLHTPADAARCLACVRRHLRPGGVCVIDVFVPDVRLLARDPRQRYPYGEYDDPADGARVYVTHSQRYDPAAQLCTVTRYTRREGEDREHTDVFTLKMWFPVELETLLKYNGFTVLRRYGGHNGAEFGPGAGKQILLTRALD